MQHTQGITFGHFLPVEKLRKTVQDAKRLLARCTVSVRMLAAFARKTTPVKQGIKVAPSFHRHLQALIHNVMAHLLTENVQSLK